MAKKVLEYKGYPLRRLGNVIYYGSMADKYIIMMQISGTEEVKPVEDGVAEDTLKVANKVSVQLQLTDPGVKARDKIEKKSEKGSLYEALDLAYIWLSRALAAK